MKKSILIAALGLLSLPVAAQDTSKDEEGFVFTTVKENRTKTVRAHAGVSQASLFWRANCFAWARVRMTCQRCLWYITRW